MDFNLTEDQQADAAARLAVQGVRVSFNPTDQSAISTVIFTYAPFVLFVAFWVVLLQVMKQSRLLAALQKQPQTPRDSPPYTDIGESGDR